MQTPAKVLAAVALAVAAFLAGNWYAHRDSAALATERGRRILKYACPMHPQYKSDQPGDCLSCGMRLEPVYETTGSLDATMSLPSTGAILLSPEKQHLIGVRLGRAEPTSSRHAFKTAGRVVPDERRVYRLNAATDGWIRDTYENSTGSLVKKLEPLASFYAPEFLAAQRAYLYALVSLDRFRASGNETPEQVAVTESNVQQARDSLRVLGMGDPQIEEIGRTRTQSQNIVIHSPATGLVLSRNISPGMRFERGDELYRVVDLSKVWILADLFENEVDLAAPGDMAQVLYQNRSHNARISEVLPQFDESSRTQKIRLETDNPDYRLRPGMFVEVRFPVRRRAAVSVPAEAVVVSGENKIVFVANDESRFEPRAVETGWRFGDQVEIVKGLMPGETIVVSGNFLLDSESRMRMTTGQKDRAAGRQGDLVIDPICGMEVSPAKAAGKSEYRGKTYYFCSDRCKREFDTDPKAVLKTSQGKTAG